MKIKLSEYKKLLKKHHQRKVLFVPQHLRDIFGLQEIVYTDSYNMLQSVTLTRAMCAYMHVDESLEGLTGDELYAIVDYVRLVANGMKADATSYERWRIKGIKHAALSPLITQAANGNSDAIETMTRLTKNFDKHQLLKEMESPEFSDTDEVVRDTRLDKKCYIVLVSQGEKTKSVATFTRLTCARKFVQRLEKALYSHHPLDGDRRVVFEKLLNIHPESLCGVNMGTPTYHIETVELIQS